jgi:hypothetical protein
MKAGPLATERQAFCATCPSAEEVSRLLATLGFSLDFQLGAQHTSQLPPLPAQYHYKDICGTEVIYLDGRDVALDGEQFPPHASRFWLYAGADTEAFTRAMTLLSLQYRLTWSKPSTLASRKEVA